MFKKIVIFVFALCVAINSSFAAKSRKSSLRSFGDYAQIINPLISGAVASQEKGFGHFAIIYAQSFTSMHGIKLISQKAKWSASKRPNIEGKKSRYEGMPSGHTNSAWVSAS